MKLNTNLNNIRNIILSTGVDQWQQEQLWGYYNDAPLYYCSLRTEPCMNTQAVSKVYAVPPGAKHNLFIDVSMSRYIYGSGVGSHPLTGFNGVEAHIWSDTVAVNMPPTTIEGLHYAEITCVYQK